MTFEAGYLLALVVIGLSFLCFVLAMMIDEVNKRKGIVTTILGVILFGLGVYYYYTVGQWQKMQGGPSVNKLNHYIFLYRCEPSGPAPETPLVPPGE
jgi:multisubunit Na+/H+ antiporter MnhB subunit